MATAHEVIGAGSASVPAGMLVYMHRMSPPPDRWPSVRGKVARVPEQVAFRQLAHETILLNVSTGKYHSIDSIGARFFEVLQQGTVEAAAATLAADYDQPVSVMQVDLLAFCDQLVELGLVELDTDGESADRPAASS